MKNIFLSLALLSQTVFAQSAPTFAQFKFSPITARANFPTCVSSRTGQVQAGSLLSPLESAIVYICDGSAWRVLGPGIAIGDPVFGGTPNSILFVDANGDLGDDANFVFKESVGKMVVGGSAALATANSARVQIFNDTTDPASSAVDPSALSTGQFTFITATPPGLVATSTALKGVANVNVSTGVTTTTAPVSALIGIAEKSGLGTHNSTLSAASLQASVLQGTSLGEMSGLRISSLVAPGATHTGLRYDLAFTGIDHSVQGTSNGTPYGIRQEADSGSTIAAGQGKINLFTANSTFAVPFTNQSPLGLTVGIGGSWGVVATTNNTVGAVTNLVDDEISSFRFTAATVLNGFNTGIGNGKRLLVTNVSGSNLTITNEAAGNTAPGRIITGTGADIALLPGSSLELAYDQSVLRWRAIGSPATVGGGGGTAEGLQLGVATQTGAATYVVLSGAERYLRCDSTGGNVSYTLPAPTVGNNGTVVWFKRVSGGVNTCTLNVTVNSTSIDGVATDNTTLLTNQYDAVALISVNGVGWEVMP